MKQTAGGIPARGFDFESSCIWPVKWSSDLFELKYGKALTEKDRLPGEVPVYGTNGRCGWHSRANFKGPGLILGRKGQGPLGVEWCPIDYWVIDTAYSLRLLQDELNLKYCYYLIKYVGLNHLKDGTSNPSLSRETFGAQLFPIPPIQEQERIVEVLVALDDKIELNRRMNETLAAMARSLFKDWFVDFGPTRAKQVGMEPYLAPELWSLFPERLDAAGKPKGWLERNLGEVIALAKGRSYKSSDLVECDTALVTLKSFMRGGGYRCDGVKSFSGTYKPEQIIEPGELVVALTDVTQSADVIGKPAVVEKDPRYQTLVASLDVGIVRPSTDEVNTAFLYCLMLEPEFQSHIYAHCTGTTVLHLSKAGIPSFNFRQPCRNLMTRFSSISTSMFDRIRVNQEETYTLAQTRDLLLPKLMSGELRVRDAERLTTNLL